MDEAISVDHHVNIHHDHHKNKMQIFSRITLTKFVSEKFRTKIQRDRSFTTFIQMISKRKMMMR